ncbi:MAG: PAS domain-containing protein, partial [Eubacterium sp.]
MKETKNQPKLPNDFYLNILENLFLCVFINDSTGKTIYTNPAVLRHYGLTPDFLIEKYPGWGFWEGIVFPPVYKELMEKKAKMLYRQRNLISHNYYTTLNTPVMKLSNPSDVEFMAQIIQENFITSDFKKKD